MYPRSAFILYVFLSLVDCGSTIFLVTHGYADEANPLINRFTSLFTSFPLGLIVYKALLLAGTVMVLRLVQDRDPRVAYRLLVFANVVMLALGAWHVHCIRVSLAWMSIFGHTL